MAVLLNHAFEGEGLENEDWSLTIERGTNCYILTGRTDMGAPLRFAIEDNPKDELESHERLLWEVVEYFNFGGSKHDPERIRIVREKRKG